MNKGRMNQRRLLPLLLLLCLSIESVMSRALISSDEWQRLAGTGANVLSDTILPCVESGSCRGRAFGSMSEDVSKFGNVPPCRFHGWVRCIEYPGPSIIDAAHGQYVPASKYYNYQQNKNSLSQQQQQQQRQYPTPFPPPSDARQSPQEYAPYPSKAASGHDRPRFVNEPPRFVSANTQSSFAHQQQQQPQQQSNWQKQEQKEREMRQQHSAATLSRSSVVEIPKHAAELQRNTGAGAAAVQFQQHPDAAAVLLPPVNNKHQSVEHWGNQPGAQRSRPESQGLTTEPIQRPVEFQPPHQRFEQSSQQIINPSKFTQQRQLTQNEFLMNNFVEPQQSPNNQQQQPVQFRQLTQPGQQQNFKTSSIGHHSDIGSQQFPVETHQQRLSPVPVESQRPTRPSSEPNQSLQQMPQRVEPIQTMNSNPSFRLVEGGQQIIDPRRFIEPPSQREMIEPQQQQQQRFVQVNQPATGPIKNEHPQQMAIGQTNREEAQRLPQANQQLVELQRPPPRPLAGQQPILPENSFQNKQQLPVTEPFQQPSSQSRPMEPQRLQSLTTQRSAEPRKLEPPPLVKSNSLGNESPQFIEPAKSPLENLFHFDSSMDTQLAREQLADLIRLLAQSASQQTDPNQDTFAGVTANQFLQPTSKSPGSNILPFIAFAEPLPLEPTSSNSLF